MTQSERGYAAPWAEASPPPGPQPWPGDDWHDPHATVFGLDPDADAHHDPAGGPGPHASRSERRRAATADRRRGRRRGRLLALLVVVLVVVAGGYGVTRLIAHFRTQDYSGTGYGSVRVSVASGDTASDIAATLRADDVVKSAQAFVDAASHDRRAAGIQPGTYVLHHHMSGAAALALLLDPASRDAELDTVVTEGATTLDVRASLLKLLGASAAPRIDAALAHPGALTMPRGYEPAGASHLSTLEGFLFPATYTFTPTTAPADALQTMVTRFTAEDRSIGFAADAAKLNLTPYEALTIASIAQSEARFAADMPKVVETILNRLKAGRSLEFDSTSSYACKLASISPCIYASVDSPYNTYRHHGLPPSPINNPGTAALQAAVHPASGNWLYFVNSDAAGHLFFTDSYAAFQKAAATCAAKHWGCGS